MELNEMIAIMAAPIYANLRDAALHINVMSLTEYERKQLMQKAVDEAKNFGSPYGKIVKMVDLISLDDKANWCLSGGADGSDLQWGMNAGKAGHSVTHWGFKGHKSSAPIEEITILPDDLLMTADIPCTACQQNTQTSISAKIKFYAKSAPSQLVSGVSCRSMLCCEHF